MPANFTVHGRQRIVHYNNLRVGVDCPGQSYTRSLTPRQGHSFLTHDCRVAVGHCQKILNVSTFYLILEHKTPVINYHWGDGSGQHGVPTCYDVDELLTWSSDTHRIHLVYLSRLNGLPKVMFCLMDDENIQGSWGA